MFEHCGALFCSRDSIGWDAGGVKWRFFAELRMSGEGLGHSFAGRGGGK